MLLLKDVDDVGFKYGEVAVLERREPSRAHGYVRFAERRHHFHLVRPAVIALADDFQRL
jgi:hypothetical protein